MSELESLAIEEELDKHLIRHSIDRLIMLSDGVFAIAITLAALEIHVPSEPTFAAVLSMMNVSILAYLVSFIVIAAFWTSNRDLFARLRHVDRPLTVLVLATLCVTALIPASVRIAGPAQGQLGGSFQFYAAVMVLSGVLNCSLWAYAGIRKELMLGQVTRGFRIKRVIETAMLPILFFAIFLSPTVATLELISLFGMGVFAIRRVILSRIVV